MHRLLISFAIGISTLKQATELYSTFIKESPHNHLSENQIIHLALKCSSGINIVRATLDHAVMDLAKENPLFDSSNARLKRAIKFPIHPSQIRFEKWRDSTIGGRLVTPQRPLQPGELLIKDLYGESAISFMESLQPYESREIEGLSFFQAAIKDIAALDNYAKHSQPYDILSFPTAQSEQTKFTIVENSRDSTITSRTEKAIINSPYFALRYEREDLEGRFIFSEYRLEEIHRQVLIPMEAILKKFADRSFEKQLPTYTRVERTALLMNTLNSMSSIFDLIRTIPNSILPEQE